MKIKLLDLEIEVLEEIEPETMLAVDKKYELDEVYFYPFSNPKIGYGAIHIEQNRNNKLQFFLTFSKFHRKRPFEHYLIARNEINKIVKHFGLFEEYTPC